MFLDFSLLKKRDVLIYDGVSLTILKHILGKEKYNVYFNRWEKINFWVLASTFFKFNYRNLNEIKKLYKKIYFYMFAESDYNLLIITLILRTL